MNSVAIPTGTVAIWGHQVLARLGGASAVLRRSGLGSPPPAASQTLHGRRAELQFHRDVKFSGRAGYARRTDRWTYLRRVSGPDHVNGNKRHNAECREQLLAGVEHDSRNAACQCRRRRLRGHSNEPRAVFNWMSSITGQTSEDRQAANLLLRSPRPPRAGRRRRSVRPSPPPRRNVLTPRESTLRLNSPTPQAFMFAYREAAPKSFDIFWWFITTKLTPVLPACRGRFQRTDEQGLVFGASCLCPCFEGCQNRRWQANRSVLGSGRHWGGHGDRCRSGLWCRYCIEVE